MTVFMALALALALTALAGAESTDKPCPWRISSMSVGKWANGNHKAGVWVKGSFPINIPGVTERPEWFINGSSVGKSQIHFANRWIPNAASRLKAGANTIKVQFNKPPYNGAYHEMTITGFDWGKVPNGGYKWYGAQ
jgi:hypothetical protein